MKAIFLVILITGTVFLWVILTGAKHSEPFHLLWGEQTNCGWDCDPDDGVIGIDETYAWAAEGNLDGLWTHTYDTEGYRVARVRAWWKGKANYVVDINGVEFTEVTQIKGQRTIEACLEYVGDIIITITGDGNLAASGTDYMAWQTVPIQCEETP